MTLDWLTITVTVNMTYRAHKLYFTNRADNCNTWNSVPGYVVSANTLKKPTWQITNNDRYNQHIVYNNLCGYHVHELEAQVKSQLTTGPRNNICYSGHVKYFSDWLIDWLSLTRSSAVAERPRDALCPWKFCCYSMLLKVIRINTVK